MRAILFSIFCVLALLIPSITTRQRSAAIRALQPKAEAAQQPAVQVGLCTDLKGVDDAKAAGFDYVELRTSEIVALSEADFERLKEKLAKLKLAVPVTYQFVTTHEI